jgi:hypothetical protein
VGRANTMLPRLLSHWHPGAEERPDDGFDWGADDGESRMPRRAARTSLWNDPLAASPAARAPLEIEDPETADRPAAGEPAEGETVVVFYRVDAGETLPGIARRFAIRSARVVADNRLDPAAKLQKGMLLKLHVPRSALSRLASERPIDDSQYAPAVQLDGGSNPDDDSTVSAPAAAPKLQIPHVEGDPFAPRDVPVSPRVKRSHDGRSSGRRSMADFPELFERKP